MKKVLTAILFCFLAATLWGTNSFEIEKVTEDYIQIHLKIDEYNIPQTSDKTTKSLSLPGLEIYFVNTEGLPKLPFLSENIGIPPEGKVSASIVSQQFILLPGVSIPINRPYKDEGILVPDPSRQVIDFSKKKFYPENIIETQPIGYVGNRYLGSFRIFPIQYNHAQKSAKLFTDLVVQIHITGDKSKSYDRSASYIDGFADRMIVNNEFSKNWRKEKEPESASYKRQNETEITQFKFIINEKGIYNITYDYLKDTLQTWIDSLETEYDVLLKIDEINPKYLQLHNMGEQVPIYFFGQDDESFDEGDYFEFYADISHGEDCFYNPFSWENVYFLNYEEGALGTRLAVEDGGLYETDPYSYRKVYNFDTKVHFENQSIYSKLSQVSQVREDLWFWQQISAPNMTNFSIQLYDPLQSNARSAEVEICFFGETYGSENNTGEHHSLSYINSSQVGSEFWYGQNEKLMSGTMSNDKLNNGSNQIYISLPGDTDASYDRILLDYIDINYWRECIAHNDMLEFNKPTSYPSGLMQFEINEFTVPDIDVYKLGVSKFENLSIESGLPGGGAPYLLIFQDNVLDNNTRYIAVSDSRKLIPKEVLPDYPSNIRNPGEQADYLVISKREFLEEDIFYDFAAHWYDKKGLVVKTISTESIYDEFNYGLRSDQAIKDFISYTYNNWQEPSPQYVLLLGDACYDERPISPNKKYSIVPSHMSWSYHVGATVDDNWFVAIVGDDELPDLAIGRIPIWETEQILPAFAKTIQYNTQPNFNDNWRNHLMLIAGGSGVFEDQSQRLNEKYIPKNYRVSRIYAQSDHDDPYWGSTTNIKDYIDDGTALIQFMGHGGGQIWSDLNLMNLGDISTLFNDNYPIISSLTCYTSNFEYPGTSCLGEAFVLEAGKGAIGFFGGAAKGFLDQDEYLGAYFLQSIFTFGERNSATICNVAKIEYALKYPGNIANLVFLRSFNYMGDPAIDIVLPTQELETILNSYQFVKGDTVSIFIENEDSTLNRISYYVTDEEDLIRNPYNQDELIQVELNNIERESYTPSGYEYVIDTLETSSEFSRIVRTYGYDSYSDYVGHTIFTVGKSAIFDITINPTSPCIGDSVTISAKVYDKEGIDHVNCVWWTNSIEETTISMYPNPLDTIMYVTESPITAFLNETNVHYRIEVWNNSLQKESSEEFEYSVKGPDIDVRSLEKLIANNGSYFKIGLYNDGSSSSFSAKLYLDKDGINIDSTTVEGLPSDQGKDVLLQCELNSGTYDINVSINPGICKKYCDEPSKIFGSHNVKEEIAIRFTTEELQNNVDDIIREILIYTPTSSNECELTLRVYEGGSLENPPGNLVYETGFGYFSSNTWIDHIPSVPIKIKPFKEYWIVYEINTHIRRRAWMDDKPGATNKGDLWLSPSGWVSVSQYYPSFDSNWMIKMNLCSSTSFLELDYSNNQLSKEFQINDFIISHGNLSTHASIDSNFVASFTSGVVDHDAKFYIQPSALDIATLLPDVEAIPLFSGAVMSYTIAPFDSSCLTQEKKFKKNISLLFNYTRTDTTIQQLAKLGNFKLYRYDEDIKCWFMIGGDTNLQDKNVAYAYISKPGVYSLFNNNDTTVPSIDVNVEGQEFTNGGYVDNNAQFSFIIQDKNGVDIEKIRIFLNGEAVTNYTLSSNNITSIPVKYQIDVDAGSYTIIISVTDVNGNYHEKVVNFTVQKEFNIINIGNYPNPISLETTDPNNEGRTRFTYTLTDDADEVKIEIYTVSGRLVNVIKDMRTTVGYHEYPHALKGWECVDRDGRKLANGVYFYKIIAQKGIKKIEKIKKMAILR
ncbi:MAG: C25 family cysteine peptidase [Candidatus Celaenobacter antarcticus]|nr:C25 family cysteine peptidase [Candidatus Celaenobacter antarcticus]